MAAALLVFALGLIPAVHGYMAEPDALVQRVGATSIWPLLRDRHSLWPLWDAVWRTLLIFHYQQGPEYHWFGIGTDPAVNCVIGFLLVHGVLESTVRWREPRHVLLLSWFAIGLLPGVLSTGAPRIYRSFLATPPLYVWAALPAARLLVVPAHGWSRAALRVLAVTLVAAVPLIDFNYYFYRVYTAPVVRWFHGERMVQMARLLRDRGPGWTGYLLADTFDARHETFRFLSRAWGLRMQTVVSLADVLPLHNPPERGALFIMSQGTLGAAAAIEQMYPHQDLLVQREPTPRSWWLDAWWPLGAPANPPPISAAAYAVGRPDLLQPRLEPASGLDAVYDVGGTPLTRREPYPFYEFLSPAMPQRFNSVWRGRLTIPDPGGYRIEVESNGDATISIDGRALRPGDELPAGVHDFRMRLNGVPGAPRLAFFWRHADAPRELVPPSAFTPPPAS